MSKVATNIILPPKSILSGPYLLDHNRQDNDTAGNDVLHKAWHLQNGQTVGKNRQNCCADQRSYDTGNTAFRYGAADKYGSIRLEKIALSCSGVGRTATRAPARPAIAPHRENASTR